jgi:hypothetical protein
LNIVWVVFAYFNPRGTSERRYGIGVFVVYVKLCRMWLCRVWLCRVICSVC